MGRPFAEEIVELEATHRWACEAPIEELAEKLRSLSGDCLLAAGSGGSLTTATLTAMLYRDIAFKVCSAVTPLDLFFRKETLRGSSVLVATAGGSNPDVIGALRTAARNGANQVLAICASIGSKLSIEAARYSNAAIEEFKCPSPRDGFLATNSLWASSILLYRGFASAYDQPVSISKRLSRIVEMNSWRQFVRAVSTSAVPIWDKESVIVLYGAESHAAAVDLESKLTEAALSNVWIADYRHFAHGRHHWLAKRGERTSIIAFISKGDRELARRTLSEIPSDVRQMPIELPNSPTASLAALAHVFPLTLSAGIACGIDPGNPRVPLFGRKIYRINAYGKLAANQVGSHSIASVSIERKAASPMAKLESQGIVEEWRRNFNDFANHLRSGRFGAIVFDYDETLCGKADRYTGLSKPIVVELNRLLSSGLHIGIATGRGKSVRESIRTSLAKKYWDRVLVGYYNGGQIGQLNQDDCPDGTAKVSAPLKEVFGELRSNHRLRELAKVEGRISQITVSCKHSTFAEECWELLSHNVNLIAPGEVKLVRSSHSFDVLPVHVSKLHVVHRLEECLAADVLAIGDMGKWPGNDCELLSHTYSLSVDQVSPDRTTCWNLAPAGVCGVDATLKYVKRLTCSTAGRARVRLSNLSGGGR